jgi:hypothetical protein
MRAGTLPMRDTGIDVLDVGVGPGPALYATSDFYELLNLYADSHRIPGLKTPSPKLHAIEASSNMVRVMHWISEISSRSGPCDRDLGDFEGVDFERLREARRDAVVASLSDDSVNPDLLPAISGWQDTWRFNLGIFSYFLTEESMVKATTQELHNLFRSMRAGGVVVITGAVAGRYRRVYKGVAAIARRELMQRIMQKESRLEVLERRATYGPN